MSRIGCRIGARVGRSTSTTIVASFVGVSDAVFSFPDDSALVTVTTPVGVTSGDTMLILIATDAGAPAEPIALPSGWSLLTTLHADSETVFFVFRRIATGSEPADHAIQMAGAATRVGAALLAYRSLDTSAALVEGAITDCDPSALPTTDFPCPSLTLAAATNLYIGCVWVIDAAPGVTPPGGTTERFDASQISNLNDPVARRFEVFDFQAVVSGATGAKTATIGIAHVGIAASIALKAA